MDQQRKTPIQTVREGGVRKGWRVGEAEVGQLSNLRCDVGPRGNLRMLGGRSCTPSYWCMDG
jgi:hypothetical protein